MSPRLNRVWLIVSLLLFVSQVWSLGLGDIRLRSSLNQLLRAEIEVVTAIPQELDNLAIGLASQELFRRYDLDRPIFLTRLNFEVVKSGRADANFIRVTSTDPIIEPLVTFLVEASWAGGRLLREYTVLLDPPIFAPPPASQSPQGVDLPARAAPADSGEIQRMPSLSQQNSVRRSVLDSQPLPTNTPEPYDQVGLDAIGFDQYLVQSGDTLWGITQRFHSDSRLTNQQAMLAIYEANREAFDGNIHRMRAGSRLTIPIADDVFRISRADAYTEISSQNDRWGDEISVSLGGGAVQIQPSLTLVPPDEDDNVEPADTSINPDLTNVSEEIVTNPLFNPVENRLRQIDAILEELDALIEIPDNELAALRRDLAGLGSPALPVEDAENELFIDNQLTGDDLTEDQFSNNEAVLADQDEEIATEETSAPTTETTPAVVARPEKDEGVIGTIISQLTNFWTWIGLASVLTLVVLMSFLRRAARRDNEEIDLGLDALDADSAEVKPAAATETPEAVPHNEKDAIVVVETENAEESQLPDLDDTQEVPVIQDASTLAESTIREDRVVSPSDSSEDTNFSETVGGSFKTATTLSLDQNDPVAEAEFHMAYGLYDQATELINDALAKDPDRQDLLAKLCEIYFAWGNREAFIESALRMKLLVGLGPNVEWDKIMIMGRQIAADHELFVGDIADDNIGVTEFSSDSDMEEGFDLDIDTDPEEYAGLPSDISDTNNISEHQEIDIESVFGDEIGDDETKESPRADLPTLEVPVPESTQVPSTDTTGEIDLDDLGIDIDLHEQTPFVVEEDENNREEIRSESALPDADRAAQLSEHEADIAEGDDHSESAVPQDPIDAEEAIFAGDEMLEVGTKLDLARAYIDMGDPSGARSILEEALEEGNDEQKQQAQHLIDSLPN